MDKHRTRLKHFLWGNIISGPTTSTESSKILKLWETSDQKAWNGQTPKIEIFMSQHQSRAAKFALWTLFPHWWSSCYRRMSPHRGVSPRMVFATPKKSAKIAENAQIPNFGSISIHWKYFFCKQKIPSVSIHQKPLKKHWDIWFWELLQFSTLPSA